MTTVNAKASESVTTADDITSNPRYALTLADGMTLAELYKTVPGGYIPERLLITSTVQPVARYGLTLADTLSLHDLQRVGFPVSASETLTLTSLAAIVAVAQ